MNRYELSAYVIVEIITVTAVFSRNNDNKHYYGMRGESYLRFNVSNGDALLHYSFINSEHLASLYSKAPASSYFSFSISALASAYPVAYPS